MCALDKERTSARTHGQASSSSMSSQSPGDRTVFKDQTLSECVKRRIVTWPVDSKEYKERISSILDMFIETGIANFNLSILMEAINFVWKMSSCNMVKNFVKISYNIWFV